MKPEYRKLRGFAAAFVLLALFIATMHVVAEHIDLKVDDESFGIWYDHSKDMSYCGISENIGDDTILLMGSSEFRHGRKTKYHPVNALSNADFDIMEIGGPFNQCLFHTVAVGAFEPGLKSRKAILLVSPTWFKSHAVLPEDYKLRFSETEYIHFLENPKITDETKGFVASRTEELLAGDKGLELKVSLANRALLGEKSEPVTKALFGIYRLMASDRDRFSTAALLRTGEREYPVHGKKEPSAERFAKMERRAAEKCSKRASNPFDMRDASWNSDYKDVYESYKNNHPGAIRRNSPEMEDLRAFLAVCRETGIEAKLIILPVNGKWFDYMGGNHDRRRRMADAVMALADEYGAECADLMQYEYEPYVTRDASHPWNVGWLKVDKEILEFCE